MDSINIIIPLGGKGERFVQCGYTVPKALISIFNKPMIFHVLDNLCIQPLDNVIIVYHHTLDIEQLIHSKYPFIHLVKLDKQTSGASETVKIGISQLKHLLHKKTLLLDCDTIYTTDIISEFRSTKLSTVFYTVKDTLEPPLYSYISLDFDNRIIDIAEKVKISANANTGAYGFVEVEKLLQYCETNTLTYNNEPYTSCVIKTMINNGEEFYGKELDPRTIISVGTPKELTHYLETTHAYLFDLDGTIVITDNIYFAVWNHILSNYGGILTKQMFQTYIQGNSDKYVAQALLPNIQFKEGELSTLKDSLFMQNIDKIQLVNGAIDYIKSVKRSGNPVCIVTNCNERVAKGILDKIGISHLIDHVVSSESCANNKPSPDPYYHALTLLGIRSDKAIIFEDSKTGILSGKSVYPKCLIGVATSYSSEELMAYGVDIAISDFKENVHINKGLLSKEKLIQYINRDFINAYIEPNPPLLKGGFIADVIQIQIDGKDCVFKLENTNLNALSQMANQLQLYEREYYFYNCVSKYIKDICIPEYVGLVKDDNYKTIGIILENLYTTGKLVPNVNLNIVSIDVSLKIIDKMAKLHSQFWNKPLKTAFPQLKTTQDSCFYPFCYDYIVNKWPIFISKWNKVLTPEQIDIGGKIKNRFMDIQKKMSLKNTTLLHGDIKSPNIFYNTENAYEPIFLDWQHCLIGKGVQDLAFFIIESFDIHKLEKIMPLFKGYYYCKIVEYGVVNYSMNEFEEDLYDAFCYVPFFTAVWFGSMSEDELIDKNFPFFFIQKLFKILHN